MIRLLRGTNWLSGSLIFFMPILLIFFLGSQMAYSQVKGRFEAYQNLPEVTRLADLETIPAGQVIMLRGRIAERTPRPAGLDNVGLVIYQTRPTDGREVRYQEEFPLIFPEFVMRLPDGDVVISPSQTREHVIRAETHLIREGDRSYTGFRTGDTVTVQGQWQPGLGTGPTLDEVTGITGADKQSLLLDWAKAFRQVGWVRNGLGLLTLASIGVFIVQLRRTRRNQTSDDEDASWQIQTTNETAPTV
jgi:hypothetical protein